MMMDERKRKVLQAIIQDYISTVEPVGSRTISRKYDLGVSPATIRNEMADLEEMGYIEQPHTSSGRIPSDKGYRFYVDCLMERKKLTLDEKDYIKNRFDRKMAEIEDVIEQTSGVLSQITKYPALVLGPQWEKTVVAKVELFPLAPRRALLVVVSSAGVVIHRTLEVTDNISSDDYQRINTMLNSRLKGFLLEAIRFEVFEEIYREFALQKDILETVVQILQDSLSREGGKVYLHGTLSIFNQPEFKDVGKLKNLLEVLDEGNLLRELLAENNSQGLSIRIGGENIYEGIHECSIVTATYKLDGEDLGSIGVIGPTRMEYSKVASLVEYISGNLSRVLHELK